MKSFILYIFAAVLVAVAVIFFVETHASTSTGMSTNKLVGEQTPLHAQLSMTATLSPLPVLVPALVIDPTSVIQGEPFLITIDGVTSTSTIKKVILSTLTGTSAVVLPVFLFESKVRALGAADLHQKPATYEVTATLSDGMVLHQKIVIAIRPQVVTAFTIPSTLGGDTAASESALVSSLAAESVLLKNLPTAPEQLWTLPFIFPVANPIVTDVYGYDRHCQARAGFSRLWKYDCHRSRPRSDDTLHASFTIKCRGG